MGFNEVDPLVLSAKDRAGTSKVSDHIADHIAGLKQQLQDQRAELERQTEHLAQLEARLAVSQPVATTRRRAFKLLAGAVVGGAVAGLSSTQRAAATDGGLIVIGNDAQTAQSETALIYDGTPSGASIFTVTDSSTGVGAALSPNSTIAAWCSGLRNIALSGYSRTVRGVGIFGSSELGTGIMAVGGVQANMQLFPEGLPGPQRTTSHNKGELACDSTGDLWFSINGGNPGTWRKVSGPATAGVLHVLPEPLRAYDSRSGAKRAAGTTTTVSVANGRNGARVTVPAVPAGAIAAHVNITLSGTVGSLGYVQVYSASLTSPPATSAINWSAPGQDIANEVTVASTPTHSSRSHPVAAPHMSSSMWSVTTAKAFADQT